jgi:Tfp pilus assembly protein PilN
MAEQTKSFSLSLLVAVLALVVVAALAGLYLWERQQESRQQNAALIDQLQRIDSRLSKIEQAQAMHDQTQLLGKLNQMDEKMAALAAAQSAAPDAAALSDKLDSIMAQQASMTAAMTDLSKWQAQQEAAAEEAQQADIQQHALLADLSALAPMLLMPSETPNDQWQTFIAPFRAWFTARPVPSASADTTTVTGKVSRALYDLQKGDVRAALAVLPDDPRLAAFRQKAEASLKAPTPAALPEPTPETEAAPQEQTP